MRTCRRGPRPSEVRQQRARELGLALRRRGAVGEPETAGSWLRAIRRHCRLSQRELAELAAVPRSTIERVERGHVVPRFDTVMRLLWATGFRLTLIDEDGGPLVLDVEHERLRDGRDRRYPAHLDSGPTPSFMRWDESGREWWGWERIAWYTSRDDEWVPRHTFWRRPDPDDD